MVSAQAKPSAILPHPDPHRTLRDARLRVLLDFAEEMELLDDVAALSEIEEMLAYFERPDVIARLRECDLLAPARIRGLRRMVEMLGAEGGVCTREQFATVVGLKADDVDQRRSRGQLIGFKVISGDWAYPVWQAGPDGLLPGLSLVMEQESDESSSGWMAFFLAQNVCLDDSTPLDALRQGDIERVRQVAELLGDQIAF